jgi:hypothetical protein
MCRWIIVRSLLQRIMKRAFAFLGIFALVGSATTVAAQQQQEMLYGLRQGYALDVLDPSDMRLVTTTYLPFTNGSAFGLTYANAELLALDWSAIFSEKLMRVQPENGFTTKIGRTGYQWIHRGLKWNRGVGKLYAVASILFGSNDLYVVDHTTGAATKIAPLQTPTGGIVNAFAIDSTGQAWATASDSFGQGLYLLDLVSGGLSFRGYLNGIPKGVVDMDFDSKGRLWACVALNGSQLQGIHTIDLKTLVATQVSHGFPYVGISFAPGCVSETYCLGKKNSIGCIPRMTIAGQVSQTQIGAIINVTGVRSDASGLLLFGLNGRAATPLQGGGVLCVAPPLFRTPLGTGRQNPYPWNGTCANAWSMDMSLYLASQPMLPAGTVVNCQWWGRDPGFSAPDNVSVSNGVEFAVCP